MKLFKILIATCLLLMCAGAYSAGEKPHLTATVTDAVTARVVALDHKTRAATLKNQEGEEFSFIVSDDVRNLDQVSVGDMVVVQTLDSVSVMVVAGDDVDAAKAEMLSVARAEEGDMPGFKIVDTQIQVAKVVAINLDNNTFKLETVDGEVGEYTARNPANLRAAAVGDVVVTAITHALAVSVRKMGE
jgi:hypothetical protein